MTRGCLVEGCERNHHARGYCKTHYHRFIRTGSVHLLPGSPRPGRVCDVDGCGMPHKAHGLCAMHDYRRTHGVPFDRRWGKLRDENSDPRDMSGRIRAEFGVIVSFETVDGDQRLTLHRVGAVGEAIRDACASATLYDENMRVVAISHPGSIYSDMLQRLPNTGQGKHGDIVQLPEPQMLARAGMRHMLHPALDRSRRPVHVNDDTWEPRTFA